MIVEVTADEIRRLVSSEFNVDLQLSFSGNARLAMKAKGVTASMEIRAEVHDDGSLELDMEAVKIAGLGLFGVPRKIVGDMIVKQAKNFPQLILQKNERGNIQLSIPGVKFLRCDFGDQRLSLEAVC